MFERKNLVSLFSFFVFLALITFIYSCNKTNENLVTTPSKTVTDNSNDPVDCCDSYQGGCTVTHRCFWVSKASGCSIPPSGTPGYVTVNGTDCNNNSFSCTYPAHPAFDDDDLGSFGNRFPNGTYEIYVFFDNGIGTSWKCKKTLTFSSGSYDPYFCMQQYSY